MKSKKLLKAIGNIEDKFILEAANEQPIFSEGSEYEKPVFVTVADERVSHRGLLTAAACFCVLIAAAVIFLQTDIQPMSLEELLPSKENIRSVELTTWILSEMQNGNVLMESTGEEIADCLYEMGHYKVNSDNGFSEEELRGDYIINIEYSGGEKATISLFRDKYCVFFTDNSENTSLKRTVFKGSEQYSRLLELSGKLAYDYKSYYRRFFPYAAKYNIIGADYLDGYAAELENRAPVLTSPDYSAADDSFYLRLTLPDGSCAFAEMTGEQDAESYYSLGGKNTYLFRLEREENAEYIIMQPVGMRYEADGSQLFDVKFFSCRAELYGDNDLLVPYTRLENGEKTDIFTVSAMIEYESGAVLADVGTGTNLEFDPQSLTAEIKEYSSVLKELNLPDPKPAEEFFGIEGLNLPEEAGIDGVFCGGLYCYYESGELDGALIGRMWAYDTETGAKELLAEGEAFSLWKLYEPICIYGNYLYYYHSTVSDNRQSPEICRIELSEKKAESIYKLSCYDKPLGHAVSGNRLYFTEYGYGKYNDLYCIDLETARVSLFKKQARDPMPYKNGIVYTHDSGVYYCGDAELKGCGIEYDGDKKLFDLSNNTHWLSFSDYCSDGESLIAAIQRQDTDQYGKAVQNYLIMKYDESKGLIPMAKTDFNICGGVFSDGLLLYGSMLYDVENNEFYTVNYDKNSVKGNGDGDMIYIMLYDDYVAYKTNGEFYVLTRK